MRSSLGVQKNNFRRRDLRSLDPSTSLFVPTISTSITRTGPPRSCVYSKTLESHIVRIAAGHTFLRIRDCLSIFLVAGAWERTCHDSWKQAAKANSPRRYLLRPDGGTGEIPIIGWNSWLPTFLRH